MGDIVGIFGGGGSSESFIQGAMVFGFMVLLLMPMMISIFMYPNGSEDLDSYATQDTIDDLLSAYNNFTSNSSLKEQPWALTGIYTPYLGGTYHYTSDGWLYGDLITNYSPSQYQLTSGKYTVVQGMNGIENNAIDGQGNRSNNYTGKVYTYQVENGKITQDGHKNGDAYAYVTMDVAQQSDIFFTDQLKQTQGEGFYYEYSGYRYCFQALQDGYTQYTDAKGNVGVTKLNATTSSLSLIWYNFVGQSGISGQLIISGSDKGVAYLTASDIIKAFNSNTNTARFEMQFNGVPMIIYIRIDPSMTSSGMSIEECYQKGYWSLMVASLSTNPVDYYSSSYSLSPEKIWDTTISLLTFDMDSYDMSPTMRSLTSIVFCGVLLTMIIAIALANPKVLLIAAIAGLIALVMEFLGGFTWPPDLSGITPDIETPEWWPW